MNVMIVDDEKLLRKGFRNMTDWSAKGIHIVGEAMNGLDALNQIEHLCPDVVITDIKMPVMDGVTLTKKIKKQYPHIAVIVLSGYDDYDYVRESLTSGASDYLLKATVDIDEIYEILQRTKINRPPLAVQALEKAVILDKAQLKQYLELQQFDLLKEKIIILIKENPMLPLNHLQNLLRDFFFFTQYTLDQLGLFKKTTRDHRYIHSTCVDFITNHDTAIEWVSLMLDELAKCIINTDTKQHILIEKVTRYIEENYLKNISLAHVAEQFYINKNYLCDVFKAHTGTTINDYITSLRIEHAKTLMRDTDKSLTEISFEAGYQNHSYFDRVFKKKTGLSPTEYLHLYR